MALLGVLTAPGVLLGPAAWAQPGGSAHSAPDVLQTAWFWQSAYQQVNPPVAPPATPPTEPSGVPKGDLAVANTNADGSSSKMSVIAFQLGELMTGATVNSFRLSLVLDSSGTQVDSTNAPVLACLPTRLWTPADGGSYTNEPSVDCSTKAKPTVKGSTYTFTITDIAQQWVGGPNLGVALVNDPANTSTPFQTVFSVKSIKATMVYTLPVVPTPNGHTGQLGGTGTGNGNGSTVAGPPAATGTTAAPPGPVTLPPSGPTTTTTSPTPAQPPQVAGSAPTTVAAPAPKSAPSNPSTAFWIAAIAIALLIVVSGVVLADDNVATPAATTTRLSRVLRARERARANAQKEGPVTDGLTALSPRQA